MINNPPPFKGLDVRIPIITPITGRRGVVINKGFSLDFCMQILFQGGQLLVYCLLETKLGCLLPCC